ncbi:MAG TPA: FAD-dependent oxidoreductase [Candidatus Sulfotelmatobacter sp.]|jgi:ferredoxin-NADP reductase|nr:FAD-dependent oxidoreductase [Candidatus Sulfotelmatobacter sp.]
MGNVLNLPNGSPNDLNIPLVVKEKKQESQDCISIVFERPRGLHYEAGNWMDIRFISEELAIGKTFSFASSPTEPDIMIAYKKGVSKFKKALNSVKSGDTLYITQYGSNGFLLNKNYSSVFIAGGIGITPFRSMIKEAVDTNSKIPIMLVYLNHTQDFPFKQELDDWQRKYQYLKIHYIVSGTEGRLTKDKLIHVIPDIMDYKSYIAGSPGMVINMEEMLGRLNVRSEDIKIDSFDGY